MTQHGKNILGIEVQTGIMTYRGHIVLRGWKTEEVASVQEPRISLLPVLACFNFILPSKGTHSDVAGIISATSSKKTVRESRTVMPGEENKSLLVAKKRISIIQI